MNLTSKAQEIYTRIDKDGTKLGDIRKIAKEIKKDHALAMELWITDKFLAMQLAILIMDKKLLSQELIDELCKDISNHEASERDHLTDWLMANQLNKDKKTIELIESWQNSSSAIQRRIFWYHQARLRWTGKTPPNNSNDLLTVIEKELVNEEPNVQWAMNFAAAQIGIHESEYRTRCIKLGEKHGLYKDDPVSKGCTPAYLPECIRIEVEKLEKKG
jgi:3-methyladenine DNA glycosylase AlkD